MMSKLHIQELLRLGFHASLVGFSEMQGFLPKEFAKLPYGISIAVQLSNPIIDSLQLAPNKLYAYHYHAVNHYLNDLALQIVNYLQKNKHQALSIPASLTIDRKTHYGHLSHKMVATRAGLGWIGKNALLVTKEFGPRLRLVTVLTDAPLRGKRPITESQCGDCQACVKACPVGAIHGNTWTPKTERATLVDVHKCAEFIEEYKDKLGAPVCGLCIQACPKGRRKAKHPL
jgi:epoxyqueuosine reductase QueG